MTTAFRISIHVLRVEDDVGFGVGCFPLVISIHVLRVEDDDSGPRKIKVDFLFQSTSSVWRTTSRSAALCCISGFQSTSSVWRTTSPEVQPVFSYGFQSTSSVWRTTAKTEKNLYLHSYNTAICIDLQSHQSVHAHVCTNNPKQSPKKPVRSIRLCGDRPTFARPLTPDGALRKSERHPAGRWGERRRVPLCSGNGCPAGKSAGCPLPGRSIWPVQP